MVTFLPSRAGRLADVPSFERAIGGAESNVACALAGSGHSVRWISRVGADGFGDHLLETIAAHGVDVGTVGRDPRRPTGIYFRTDGERPTTLGPVGDSEGCSTGCTGAGGGTAEVVYYRAGSAASAMSPRTVDLAAVDDADVLHLTGITAALSPECLELMRVLTGARARRPLVSFDVNYRVGLWDRAADRGEHSDEPVASGPGPGPGVLLELARGCDLVFVGEDEAEAAWGVTGGPHALRERLPEPGVLVVKQGATGATAFVRREAGGEGADGDRFDGAGDDVHTVPALHIDVAGAVGAGDGFAAGFISATLRGLSVRERLRHGHLMAAAALTVPGDLAKPPEREVADRLAALDDEAWGTLRLGPGWNTQKANVR
jgi:2-dehydro-3-deoxygluconokinase